MMMALGTFVFSLPELAYQQLQRSVAWRHASTERVGARAAHQFLGPGEETIELSGLVAPELTGTPASLDTLRELADEGRPLALVDGTGLVHGSFVITGLNETRTLFFPDGAARRIEFQLRLLRVDDEAAQGRDGGPRSNA
ncbi:MAG TPA: phage tail protein [Lysobacter sp.]|nr:phage tail protein [Lysobacter sp.]